MKVLTPCGVPGCNLYAKLGGMCKAHYDRSLRIKKGLYKGNLDDPIREYHKRVKPVGPNDLLDKYKPKMDSLKTAQEKAYLEGPLLPVQAAQRQETADDNRYKAMGMAELLAQLDIARNAIVHITRELRRRLG